MDSPVEVGIEPFGSPNALFSNASNLGDSCGRESKEIGRTDCGDCWPSAEELSPLVSHFPDDFAADGGILATGNSSSGIPFSDFGELSEELTSRELVQLLSENPVLATAHVLDRVTDNDLRELFSAQPQLGFVFDGQFWKHRMEKNFFIFFRFVSEKACSTVSWERLYNESCWLPDPMFYDYSKVAEEPFEVINEMLVEPELVRFIDFLENPNLTNAIFELCLPDPRRFKRFAAMDLTLVRHEQNIDFCIDNGHLSLVHKLIEFGYFPSAEMLSQVLEFNRPHIHELLVRCLISSAAPRSETYLDFWTIGSGREVIKALLKSYPYQKNKREPVQLNHSIISRFLRLKDRKMIKVLAKNRLAVT